MSTTDLDDRRREPSPEAVRTYGEAYLLNLDRHLNEVRRKNPRFAFEDLDSGAVNDKTSAVSQECGFRPDVPIHLAKLQSYLEKRKQHFAAAVVAVDRREFVSRRTGSGYRKYVSLTFGIGLQLEKVGRRGEALKLFGSALEMYEKMFYRDGIKMAARACNRQADRILSDLRTAAEKRDPKDRSQPVDRIATRGLLPLDAGITVNEQILKVLEYKFQACLAGNGRRDSSTMDAARELGLHLNSMGNSAEAAKYLEFGKRTGEKNMRRGRDAALAVADALAQRGAPKNIGKRPGPCIGEHPSKKQRQGGRPR